MKSKIFYNLTWVTLISIYLVILAGSIVRTTGSGMGCPDWPKCFGQWIPPTEVSQLPSDYKEIFLNKRLKKMEKYSSFLTRLGYADIAEKLNSDPHLKKEESFVPIKTWIEYINRLFGFMAGNFLILMTIISLFLFKKDKRLFLLSFLTLILTGIQGWFGSIVVASNLTPWTITFHMLMALIIVYLLVMLVAMKKGRNILISGKEKLIIWSAFILSLMQIYFGTQVRQEIDVVSKELLDRSEWIEQLSSIFELHRSFAILVLLINGYLIYKLRDRMSAVVKLLILVLVIEVLSGIVMAYFSVPKAAQPTHLLLSTIMFGLHAYILCRVTKFETQESS